MNVGTAFAVAGTLLQCSERGVKKSQQRCRCHRAKALRVLLERVGHPEMAGFGNDVSAAAKAPDWLSGSTSSSRAPLMSRKRTLLRSAICPSAVAWLIGDDSE
jgi:hypothetical protein